MTNIKIDNKLATQFKSRSLFRFAMPTMWMLIVLAVYSLIDGFFVARFVNETALAALNLVFPWLSLFFALAIMLASGGAAFISQKMGQGQNQLALETFSELTCVAIFLGFILTLIYSTCALPMVRLIGATPLLQDYAKSYLQVISYFSVMCFFQVYAQVFFNTAGKPLIGFLAILTGGLANILFDYLFIVVAQLGIMGAALGTGISFSLPGLIFLIYFTLQRKGTLYFIKPKFNLANLLQICLNGLSEFVTNLAIAVTTVAYNLILLKFAQERGVAAISAILYFEFVFNSAFIGYAAGILPVIGYKYGAKEQEQLHLIFKTSFFFIFILSLFLFVFAFSLPELLVKIFISAESSTFSLAVKGMKYFSFSFLFAGYNIYTETMFTAYSNGKVSALLSFLRTFVFLLLGLFFLPSLFAHFQAPAIYGVWFTAPLGEFLTLILSALMCWRYHRRYSLF